MTTDRNSEFTEFVSAREGWLRRLAFMLCHDWHSADDLVQATITRLYVRWHQAAAADNVDAYVRTMLVLTTCASLRPIRRTGPPGRSADAVNPSGRIGQLDN